MQRNVMQTLAALLQKASHWRVLARRLQQLDAAVIHRNHGRSHLLMLDSLLARHSQTHGLIKSTSGLDALDCNSEVINLCHGFAPRSSKTLATSCGTSWYGS